jgi:hypothetical protein
MSHSPNEERRAFAIWLRTGRRRRAGIPVEVKYNHWHDAQNGQFTEANTGRHDGSWGGGGFTGGGGGGFSGGGATATGDRPTPKPRKPRPGFRPVSPNKPADRSAGAVVVRNNPPALRRINRNGYNYDLDDADRTKDIQDTINRGDPNTRSRTVQRRAGLPDRRPDDDRGHFIAPRFNGPAEAFNHFAQDANFNRGTYRALEDEWDTAEKAGKKIYVRIVAFYKGQSKRPSQLVVSYTIGSTTKQRTFQNERQEKPNAKR